jgi:hypothetical protein
MNTFSGTDFVQSLPMHPGPLRERAILDAVRANALAPVAWSPVFSAKNGRSLQLYVTSDALRVGNEIDSVRINACARTAQQIADVLGCILPTTRICDLVWEQAIVRVTPCIGGAGPDMSDTSRMVAHHACVERKVAGRAGLAETVGKNWVISNVLLKHAGRAANYGWYDARAPYRSAPGGRGAHRVWQPLGVAHNLAHVDYSQIVRLVHRMCILDGEVHDVVDVMRDAALASLVSDEGPMRLWRVPEVPVVEPRQVA